jgi:hypothetical protein
MSYDGGVESRRRGMWAECISFVTEISWPFWDEIPRMIMRSAVDCGDRRPQRLPSQYMSIGKLELQYLAKWQSGKHLNCGVAGGGCFIQTEVRKHFDWEPMLHVHFVAVSFPQYWILAARTRCNTAGRANEVVCGGRAHDEATIKPLAKRGPCICRRPGANQFTVASLHSLVGRKSRSSLILLDFRNQKSKHTRPRSIVSSRL